MSVRFVNADSLVPVELTQARRAELAARATQRFSMRWFETGIAVAFDDAEAAALYARRYARFAHNDAAQIMGYAVRASDATYYWTNDGPAYVCGEPLRSVPLQFLADIAVRDRYFLTCRYSSFHAAAVTDGTVAAAITALSEGGKTTTAVACARRGLQLYSDEWCILDGVRVLPFPRNVNVRRGGLDLLLGERCAGDDVLNERLAARAGADWESVDIGEISPGWTPPPSRPLRAIFFISGRARTAEVTVMPLDRAMRALLEAPLRGNQRGFERAIEARALLRTAVPYALTLGTPDSTATLIAQICAASGSPKDPPSDEAIAWGNRATSTPAAITAMRHT
ncbi:MAG: hypothetical protein GIW95_02495 [Candidatus Eremiobacteraeota bacterium]|nr:hypothetical protein [Candidatus Eremiobacteraeota bacterium]